MGVQSGYVDSDGAVLVGAGDGSVGGRRSCLVWESPELRLSLGDGPLTRLLPQLWVPVAASSAVILPRRLELRRALVSEAGDGVSAAGTFSLSPAVADERDGRYALAVRR